MLYYRIPDGANDRRFLRFFMTDRCRLDWRDISAWQQSVGIRDGIEPAAQMT